MIHRPHGARTMPLELKPALHVAPPPSPTVTPQQIFQQAPRDLREQGAQRRQADGWTGHFMQEADDLIALVHRRRPRGPPTRRSGEGIEALPSFPIAERAGREAQVPRGLCGRDAPIARLLDVLHRRMPRLAFRFPARLLPLLMASQAHGSRRRTDLG